MARMSNLAVPRQMVTATPPRLKPSPKTDGSLEIIFALFALFAPWCANFELGNHCPSSTYVQELRHPGAQISNTQLTSNNYLKERQTIQDVKTEGEFAADLLRELGNVDPSVIHRACLAVANLQIFRAIREFGDEALRDMLLTNPSSYLTLLNTLCNMVQPTIDLENHRRAL